MKPVETSGFQPVDWYDFPGYFDIVHQDDTRHEAAFLDRLFERHVESRGRSILEPACGSGRILGALLDRAYSVAGFDNNPAMLAAAKRRLRRFGRRAWIFPGGLDDFRTRRRFDLAFCLISTVRYLLTEASARRHLGLVRDCMRPGGVYVLGLHLADYHSGCKYRERWVGQREGVQVVCNLQSWPPDRRRRLTDQRLRMVITENGHTKRYETCFQLRSYNLRELRDLLRSVRGLEHVATYDFNYDADRPARIHAGQLDYVLVLKRV